MPVLTAFSSDAAARLAGPEWLTQRRVEAAARFAAASWPTFEEEEWRYSPIDDLDLSRFSLVGADPEAPTWPAELEAQFPVVRAGLVVVVNGRVVHAEIDDGLAARGVYVGRLVEHESGPEAMAAVTGGGVDALVDLNEAFAADPVLVHVPDGTEVSAPIVVAHWTNAPDAAVFTRLVVRAGANSGVRVLDLQMSADVQSVVVPRVELDVGAAARLGYEAVQDVGPRVWQIASQVGQIGDQGHLVSGLAAMGGAYARLRTDTRLVGRGASGDLLAAYFGRGRQTLDFRAFQDHVAPDTTSKLMFKGVLDDHSRSIYTGLIQVRPDASGTNAFQTNRNIKLSEDAWAESVPNLEIENNDVKCSHASTVGPIDEEQRFYLESRGVAPRAAERLIVAGFFQEVIGALPVPEVTGIINEAIHARLYPPASSGEQGVSQ